MSFVEGSGDLYGLGNLQRIVCPDCGKGYLQKVQKDPSNLICAICKLLINEDELAEELTTVPATDQGISINSKPYFNQIGANEKYHEPDKRRSGFSLDTMTNKDILQQYTLSNLAQQKKGGMTINNRRSRKTEYGQQQETIEAVKKLMKHFGTDVKVELL
jgi:hypothetical protein